MAANVVAEFDEISKTYPGGLLGRSAVQALQGVSFQVLPGEVLGLLGPNRAGKTTLIKILLSLCQPTSGRAMRLGRPVSDRSTLARVGYVHENQAFPRYWNATGLLEYYGALTLMEEPEVRKQAARLLERVGLADRRREPVARFSKGMIQRLGLAQALLNDPDLLVLDEPTEGLDLEGRKIVQEMIRERRQRGRSVVVVTHALTEVEHLCDRVVVLVGGRLAYAGLLADLGRDAGAVAARPLAEALHQLYENSVS